MDQVTLTHFLIMLQKAMLWWASHDEFFLPIVT